MFVDARRVAAGTTITADICVVGAGPAGITLAREFGDTDLSVAVLESGGLQADESAQSLCCGTAVGDPFPSLAHTRRRMFGGTANAWRIRLGRSVPMVRYRPLDEAGFLRRDWVPYSGWPFGLTELTPYYQRAQTACRLGPFAYDAESWIEPETPALPLAKDRVGTSMFQFGPASVFTLEARDELGRSRQITVYLHANVVELETSAVGDPVSRARVRLFDRRSFWISAHVFILAAGGLENARLLLMSNRTQRAGLGNEHDLVGRFFMEHPLVSCGFLIPAHPRLLESTALYDIRRTSGVAVMGHLTFTKELLQRERLLSLSTWLFPRPRARQLNAVESWRRIGSAGRTIFAREYLSVAKQMLTGIDYLVPAVFSRVIGRGPLLPNFGWGGWSRLRNPSRRFTSFEVFCLTEQPPDPLNRVVLSAKRDALGEPATELHWRWGDASVRSLRSAVTILADELARAGVGRFVPVSGSLLPQPSAHHLGTTRMHTDPRYGVVSEHCRVHSVPNLFIAGGSVFPTGGYANPTLTIVALAIRLADHVKRFVKR